MLNFDYCCWQSSSVCCLVVAMEVFGSGSDSADLAGHSNEILQLCRRIQFHDAKSIQTIVNKHVSWQ